MKQLVELSVSEWQQVMGMLALAPWRDANPLLMKIGAQLQAQMQVTARADAVAGMGEIGGAGDGLRPGNWNSAKESGS